MEQNTPLKRHREEDEEIILGLEEDFKRHKSYKDIITLLEEEEDEPNQDLSSLISTLQEELSSGSEEKPPSVLGFSGSGSGSGSGSEEEEGEKVMRHLLEASDDELGIPSTDGFDSTTGGHVDGGDLLLPVGESLWEFEDHEAANYYNLLQSEIFL